MFVLKHFYGVYMAMQSNCLLDSTFRYYLNNEYIDYDYDFEKDILPHINNMFPDLSPMKIRRPLENIHIFTGQSYKKPVVANNAKVRITAQGLEFLDALKNDNIVRQIKDFSFSTAIDVGKSLLTKYISLQLGL